MLILNKFNGYQPDGCRILPVGGGVGEAMLLGAAMGGGSAAITGGDPLKGAVIGGLTGGVGAGVSGAIGGATAGTTAATTGAATGAGAAGAAGAGAAGTAALPAGQSFAEASRAAMLNSVPPISGLPLSSVADQTLLAPFQATASAPTASALAPTGFTSAGAAPTTAGGGTFTEGMARFAQNPLASLKANPFTAGASAIAGATGATRPMEDREEEYSGPLRRFRYSPDVYRPRFAGGGIASLSGAGYDRMVGDMPSTSRMAQGGISHLGSYSDGGRMLKGPGDGMSDSIPASISNKRPARLADGEFVVPADVVSGVGNGSTDAGARQLYAMMDRVRQKRTGTKKQGREINPRTVMPA